MAILSEELIAVARQADSNFLCKKDRMYLCISLKKERNALVYVPFHTFNRMSMDAVMERYYPSVVFVRSQREKPSFLDFMVALVVEEMPPGLWKPVDRFPESSWRHIEFLGKELQKLAEMTIDGSLDHKGKERQIDSRRVTEAVMAFIKARRTP